MPESPSEISELILFNVGPKTKEFLLVIGPYNASVVKGFGQPVVALTAQGWFPDYRFRHPFWGMRRAELVISRVAPVMTGTVVLPSGADEVLNADFNTNAAVMRSIAKDPWIRSRCVVSNGGVFQIAQQRFRAGFDNPYNVSARQEYLKHFVEFPLAEHVRIIAEFCAPPSQRPIVPAPTAPPKPSFNSQFEWDTASPEAKAAALFNWQSWWADRSTPAITSGAAPKIVLPASSENDDPASTAGWKGDPTPEQLESMRDESWKKY